MLTLAVQAGGRSRRMGRDKALVPLGGVPLIEHVLRRTEGLADEVLVTTNSPAALAHLNVRLVADRQPGAGALPGLLTALEAARGDRVLVLACDLPFVSRPLLEHLLSQAQEAELVLPRWQGRLEPLHAVYARSAAPAVRQAIAQRRPQVSDLVSRLSHRVVEPEAVARWDPEGWSFFNVNTPEDLRRAEQVLLEQPPAAPLKTQTDI